MEVGRNGAHVQKHVMRDSKSANDKISIAFHMRNFLATGERHYKHELVVAKNARRKNVVS